MMRKYLETMILASAIAGGLAVASPLYAEDTQPSAGPSQGTGTMGGGMMGGNGGSGGMMGGGDMMGMMKQMSQMMETCNTMMQSSMGGNRSSPQPNAPQPNNGPAVPEKKG